MRSKVRFPRRATAATVAVLAAGSVTALVVEPAAQGRDGRQDSAAGHQALAVADSYSTGTTGTLAVSARSGILANDRGGPLQLVSHTEPAHGSLTVDPDGSLQYVPAAGFTGTDSFTYTVSNAVSLYTTHLPSLGAFGGVSLSGGGFGSSLYPVPGHSDEFYGLEDRGPNVSAPNGDDVLPLPSFDPSIGEFRFEPDGKAVEIRTIPLQDASGHPYSGLVNTGNSTGETMENLQGQVLANDPDGYDSEGLVAMPDGSFWVSDEYGPYITHFTAAGRQIQRLSPQAGTLPRELANRVPNKGMEGLTITPDGRTLVGMMQSALQQPDLGSTKGTKIVPTRIVTYDLRTHAVHEYLYLLHDPATTGTAVSEITALSDTKFLVDERDGNWPGTGAFKRLYEVDLSHATDIGPSAHVPGAVYNGTGGGLLVGGKTIEELTAGEDTATAQTTLQSAGIQPVSSSLYIDINAMLLSLDPQARFFSHDKIEGVAALDHGHEIVISNDSDFGIAGVTNTAPPWQLEPKISPATGQQDDGEYLVIDPDRLDSTTSAAPTSTATVSINVG